MEWGPLKGRLVKTAFFNQELASTPLGVKEVSQTFNYDKYGNVIAIYEFNGYITEVAKQWQKTTSKFDIMNRVIQKEIYPEATASTPEVAFTYTYDPLGRLDAVKDKLGDVIQKNEYNAIGQLVQANFGKVGGNRVLIDYAYHFRGWLKKIHAVNQAGTILFNQDLKYEDGVAPKFNGNISEYNYALYTSGVKNYAFGYDELDRLVSAVTTNTEADPNDNGHFDYTYYPNGTLNTTTRKSQTFTYQYTASTNQLNHVTYTGTSPRDTRNLDNFVYDLSGRMVVDESKQMDLRYDNFNDRPVQFNQGTPSGNVASYMVYDAGGNRVSKMEYVNGIRQEAKHYFGNGKEIREYPAAATVEVYPLDNFGRIIKNGANWESEVYVKNNLGSTVAVHNITRDAQAYRTDYEPYGKLKLEVLTSAVGVTNQFTGKMFEERIGLYNFGARWMDPDLGIWIGPDPAGQFFSGYAYGPDPVNSVDPDGNYVEAVNDNGKVTGCVDPSIYFNGDLIDTDKWQGVAVLSQLNLGTTWLGLSPSIFDQKINWNKSEKPFNVSDMIGAVGAVGQEIKALSKFPEGWNLVKGLRFKGAEVYKNGMYYISKDVTSHNVSNGWKVWDKLSNVGKKAGRGTYDEFGKYIKK